MPNIPPKMPLTVEQNQAVTLEACKAITFHPCTQLQDFLNPQPNAAFAPLFTHAFFPEERMAGWLQCKIRIFFTTDTFDVYIDVDGVPAAAAVGADMHTARPSAFGLDNTTAAAAVTTATTSDNGSDNSQAAAGGGAWDDLKSKAIVLLKQHLSSKVPFAGGFCDSQEAFTELLKPTVKSQFVPSGELYAKVKFVHTTEDKQREKNTKDHPENNTNSAVERLKVTNKAALASGIETLYLYKSIFAPVATPREQPAGASPSQSTVPATVHTATMKLGPDEGMQRVHRRVEWLLHFFIDACSSIEYDQRWCVFFAYVKRSAAAVVARNEDAPPVSYQRGKRQRNEAIVSSSVNEQRVLSADRTTAEQQQLNPTHRHSSLEASSSKSAPSTYFEFLGFTSLYKFFALPQCRLRLSQFFVLPTYQNLGLGVALLQVVHRMTLRQDDVMEFAVEDPAPAFKQLRDIVSMQLALDTGAIRVDHLYPPKDDKENHSAATDTDHSKAAVAQVDTSLRGAADKRTAPAGTGDNDNPQVATASGTATSSTGGDECDGDGSSSSSSSEEDDEDLQWGEFECDVYAKLRKDNKESMWQAQRIINLLRFARLVPHPMPTNNVDPPHGTTAAANDAKKSQKLNTATTSTQAGISALLPVRTGGTVSPTKSPQGKRSRMMTSSTSAMTGLAAPVPPSVAYLLGRNWRYTGGATEHKSSSAEASGECFMSSPALRKYRLRTKRQLRTANIEWIGALSGAAAKTELQALWTQSYMSFYRTLRKLRMAHDDAATSSSVA